MKKVIFSGLLMLTVGMVSAKDIQTNSNLEVLNTQQIELSDSVYLEMTSEEGSKACKWAGRIARVAARLLGVDKEEAKEIGEAVEELCNELT